MATTIAPTEAVRVASGSLLHEARATAVVWQREMIRFTHDRGRIIASLMQPVLFLFVMGTGLSSLMRGGPPGVADALDFRTFLYPGVLAMSVLFTAAFSGISMVWDREFGFLREMMVAPISTTSIMLGKGLGGATVATVQSVIILALAGLVNVPYSPAMLAELVALLFLMSFLITSIGMALAARLRNIQSAMPMVQLIITPMMFLSGALFPLSNLPGWLALAIRLNPMTYAVEPVRSVVFDHLDVPPEVRAVLDPGITWGSYQVPISLMVGIVVVVSALALSLAVARFARTE